MTDTFSFRKTDCDIDHYLVIANLGTMFSVREEPK